MRDPLSPLEAAVGMPLGGGPTSPLPATPGLHPRAALEEATLPALLDGPCWVGFSGGRDSSLVLAAAASMAARAGLEPPIPLTFRFPGVPSAEESSWQQRVIDYLGLRRWVTVELSDELDLLGPTATGLLRAIGAYWPANAHFALRLAQRAGEGTLLTGQGGDELFAWWRWHRAATVLGRRSPARVRDVPTVALALAPRMLRRAYDARNVERLAWLTDEGAGRYRSAVGRFADVPWRWDRQLAWMRARDGVRLSLRTLALLSEIAGVRIATPLLQPRFLGALASAGGQCGTGGRRLTLTQWFDGLLPADVLSRRDKATFGAAFWGPNARDFAQVSRDGPPAPTLVDGRALRATWRSDVPDWRSADLLHRVWLSANRQ